MLLLTFKVDIAKPFQLQVIKTYILPLFVRLNRLKKAVLKQRVCPCLQKLQQFEYFMDSARRVPVLMNAW